MARIAYLASDIVVSVQPALKDDSEFSKHLNSYRQSKAPGVVAKELPEVRLLTTDPAGLADG